MKNRKLLLIVSLVLALTMSLGGTLAYLQDSDADVNVMTLGSVTITQNEHQRAKDADGSYKTDTIDNKTSYVLEVYENDKPLLPTTEIDENCNPINFGAGDYDTTTVRMTQIGSYGGMQVFKSKNAADKFVTVTNTGKTDAYVRTIVAIEIGSTQNKHDLEKTGNENTLIRISSRSTAVESEVVTKQPWLRKDFGIVTINGNTYGVVEFVYAGAQTSNGLVHKDGILPAGETTYPSLCQVYLTSVADNDDMVDLDGNKNGKLDILVLSQAIQAEGFDTAAIAFKAGFGDVTAENIAKWYGDTKVGTPGKDWPSNDVPGTWVSTADELVAALEAGEDVALTGDVNISPANMSNGYGKTGINVKNGQTIDGNGNTLDIEGAGGTWDSGISTTGGLIKNITVTGSFRGIFINHNSDHSERVVLENVTIDGTTYPISCDQGTGKGLTATNSTFNGWTSYAATLDNAKFVNCNFGEGAGYAFCRPYAPTEFVGCEFEAGYQIDARAACTFENCTFGGEPLTAENLATLVTYNAENASVK